MMRFLEHFSLLWAHSDRVVLGRGQEGAAERIGDYGQGTRRRPRPETACPEGVGRCGHPRRCPARPMAPHRASPDAWRADPPRRHQNGSIRTRNALAFALITLTACAPTIIPAGPQVTTPRVTDEALYTGDGMTLPLRVWTPKDEPARAVILAIHGFNDYSNAFTDFAGYVKERGVAVYAYDQRGFGEAENRGIWPGTQTLVDDLKAACSLIAARHPDRPLYLLGESMGGAVALVAMTGEAPPPVEGVILVAPAVWGRETMPWYQKATLWAVSRAFPGLKLSGSGLGIRASDNINMLKALSRDPLFIKETRVDAMRGVTDLMDAALAAAPEFAAPALVLYGEKDEIIPPEATFLMWRRLPTAARERQRLALYEEGFHMLLRDVQAETVWRDITAWIDDQRTPLPSEADAYARAALARQE